MAHPITGVRVDQVDRLAIQRRDIADRAGDQADLLIAQRAPGVVVVDGDVDPGVRRNLPQRGVDPLSLRRPGHVRNPRWMRGRPVGAHRLQRDVNGLSRMMPGGIIHRGWLLGERPDCEHDPQRSDDEYADRYRYSPRSRHRCSDPLLLRNRRAPKHTPWRSLLALPRSRFSARDNTVKCDRRQSSF